MIQMTWPDDGVLDDVWVKVSLGSDMSFIVTRTDTGIIYIVSLLCFLQSIPNGTEAPTTKTVSIIQYNSAL